MKTIVFDIDSCVADVQTPFVARVNELGHALTYEGITAYNLKEFIPLTDDEIWDIYKEIIMQHDYTPIDGAVSFFRWFVRQYKISPVFCTARCETTRLKTITWLRRTLSCTPYVLHQQSERGLNHDKSYSLRLIGTTHMVEDNLGTAITLAKEGINIALFDQPWNQQKALPYNVTRVKSWLEVKEWYTAD